MSQEPEESWEEDFDNLVQETDFSGYLVRPEYAPIIKSFIHSTIEEERKKAREEGKAEAVREIREAISNIIKQAQNDLMKRRSRDDLSVEYKEMSEKYDLWTESILEKVLGLPSLTPQGDNQEK